MADQIFDSPAGWVAKHIREYVETDGRKGHRWHGVPTLLLTTRGRRTGKLRRTALIYDRDGDAYVVIASRGGARHHPQWYLNLVADPEVAIQVGADRKKGRAGPQKARSARDCGSRWSGYGPTTTATSKRRSGRSPWW